MMRERAPIALAILLLGVPAGARTFRTAHFTITVRDRTDPARLGDALERAYRSVREYGLKLPATIPTRLHSTTTEFAARSGAGRSHLAAVRAGLVHLQPLAVLERHGDMERALTHELVHVALWRAGSRLPLWLAEGMAMSVAGERHPVAGSYATAAAIDRALASSTSHAGTRRAYAAAERLTAALLTELGRATVLSALRSIIDGSSAGDGFRRVAGIDLGAWAQRRLSAASPAR